MLHIFRKSIFRPIVESFCSSPSSDIHDLGSSLLLIGCISVMAPSRHRVALVTGAASGIGRAVARHLLDSGWRVGVLDLPKAGLARAFSKASRNVVLIEGDVTEEDTADRAITALTEKFGRLDGLVADRKSTRLNSSHLGISYAVFC